MEVTKPPELPPYVDRVFELVDRIPPGRVMAYGDVAEWLGEGGPRQVGTAMAKYGGGSPWWRVVRSDGGFLPGHEREALANYREEGTPLKAERGREQANSASSRIDMNRARWWPGEDESAGGGAMDEVPSDFAG
ncbi:MGMT family protein [Catenulispora pinisilvae]|uniref:MGMT family protein n=1 Tax=Catenulispora pinisilvae TaxID=2705253 RepID=UPI001890E760